MMEFCNTSSYISEPKLTLIADRQWERVWMDEFKPMRFGHRLWICPSWCAPPEPSAINIILDPGLAFGTGTHPTTAMCLETLESMDLTGKTVIDYGCGSGILGIAAMKLGSAAIWAVDNDPQALIATQGNAEKNNIDFSSFHIEHADVFKPHLVNIVVANILAHPLIELSDRLMKMTKHHIVLSGILLEQADRVMQAYQKYFNFTQKKEYNDWVCLLGVRK